MVITTNYDSLLIERLLAEAARCELVKAIIEAMLEELRYNGANLENYGSTTKH